jgi:cytochrome b pre-mRNA-processing protein 3
MFASITRRRRLRAQAEDVYAALLRQTRAPALYRDMGVPDTFDGRFDLLVLHAFLVFRRLGEAGEAGRSLAQAVFNAMFADMDHVLRESGVGDLSVGRKIRGMSEAFYGRVKAYDEALAAGDGDAALKAALIRNVFAGAETGLGEGVLRLARYVRSAEAGLKAAGLESLASGVIPFPQLEGALP